jgi:hypothetical protein
MPAIISSVKLVVATCPGVDDLVVLLAEGDQAVIVLLLVFLGDLSVSATIRLGIRDDHVVLAERNACAAGMTEAKRHNAVGEDHGLLLAAVAVDDVEHLGDVLLRHFRVADVERHLGVTRQAVRR